MNITIERLMAKVGHLSVAQDLLVEENECHRTHYR
jgi:hypothetical protein